MCDSMNHTRLPKEVLLPDSARQDMKSYESVIMYSTKFLQNVRNHTPRDTMLHPRRLEGQLGMLCTEEHIVVLPLCEGRLWDMRSGCLAV